MLREIVTENIIEYQEEKESWEGQGGFQGIRPRSPHAEGGGAPSGEQNTAKLGAGSGVSPDTSGLWNSLVSPSFLFSLPWGRMGEKTERRRNRGRRACLPAGGQTLPLIGSPLPFPPTLSFLRKVPGSSSRDLWECLGLIILRWGHFALLL